MHDNFARPGRGLRLDIIRLCERRRPAQKQGKDDRVFHSIAHFMVSFEIISKIDDADRVLFTECVTRIALQT
jgi:hypothetical protein